MTNPWILALVLSAALPAPAQAASGTLSTLSYNVAGLLEGVSGSNPSVYTPIISCKIKGYTLVNVQEDFNYHAALYDSCDDHPYRSSTSGGMGIGDGLNTLSYLPFDDWFRGDWSACNGVDCLTPKGWTQARVRLAEGVYVSLFNLHTQAQVEPADLAARRSNILQLLAHIEAQAPTDAVIVMGDTNTRYTRSGDNVRELLKHGFSDVWVQRQRGGSLPALGAPALTSCGDPSSAGCEVVDKVFYRNSPYVTLEPTSYLVDSTRFVDGGGNQLSDHYPVHVNWRWSTSSRFLASDTFGGPHGTAFNDVGTLPVDAVPRKLVLRSGSRLDRVELALSNGDLLSHGGTGGSDRSLTLGSNEFLRSMYLCAGKVNGHTRIFHAKFTTTANKTLAGGSTTSDCKTYSAPSGWQIAGLHGRSGDGVDKLGAVYTRIPTNIPGPASYTQFVNRQSGLCQDIKGGTMANGTPVQMAACNGGSGQKWRYDADTGLVRSQRDTRYCLDNNGNYSDGATLAIRACTGSANQRFRFDAASGILALRTEPAQLVDVTGSAVTTHGDQQGSHQRWLVMP